MVCCLHSTYSIIILSYILFVSIVVVDSVPAQDFKMAVTVLEKQARPGGRSNVVTQITIACDPDELLPPGEWGMLLPAALSSKQQPVQMPIKAAAKRNEEATTEMQGEQGQYSDDVITMHVG